MYISHINNVIQQVEELEWECRRKAKGLSKPEYWTWLSSITSQDENGHDVVTYPSEDFTIVECTDEDVQARFRQLEDYINLSPPNQAYNIEWSDDKDTVVMTTDIEGNSVKVVESEEKDEDPDSDTFGDVIKTNYKMSHFSGDDTAKDARLLADKWVDVRRDRDARLAETDYLALSDQTLSGDMETYREALRDVPSQSDPDNISWPVKPS
jgi:hypothetical protein